MAKKQPISTLSTDPLNDPPDVPRSRQHPDPTIQRALDIVAQDLNPIQVVTPRAPVHGWRQPDGDSDTLDPNIYINPKSDRYKGAKNPKNALAQVLLASTLVHEQIHNTDRRSVGEAAARRKQADFLISKLDTLTSKQDRLELLKQIAIMNELASKK